MGLNTEGWHASGGAAFHYLPHCQPDEIRARECCVIWKLRMLSGQACPQIRALIRGQECNSNLVITADGTLEKTRAFTEHIHVGENSFGNSAEQLQRPSLLSDNRIFTDGDFSHAFDWNTNTPLQHLANHPRAFVCLALTYVWSRFRPTACQNCSTTVAMKTAITGLVFWEVRRELCACVAWIHPYLGLCPLTVYRDLQWHVILI